MFVPNFGPIGVQMWPPGGVSRKCKSAISEVTMIAVVTKLLLYVYLVRLYFMSGEFVI